MDLSRQLILQLIAVLAFGLLMEPRIPLNLRELGDTVILMLLVPFLRHVFAERQLAQLLVTLPVQRLIAKTHRSVPYVRNSLLLQPVTLIQLLILRLLLVSRLVTLR